MTAAQIVIFLLAWGILGCLLLSVFVIFAFRSGLVYIARKEDGTLKNKIPLKGILAMAIIPVGLAGLQLASNDIGLVIKAISLDYWPLFLLNYGVYLIFFIFDTFIIDGYVLSTWRPAFLRIPDAMGKESMKKHILVSLPIGLAIGAVLTLANTALSYFLWMK